MLTQLKQPLASGQSFPLSLRFETAEIVEMTVKVKATGAGAAMDMGGAGYEMQHMNMPA